VVAPGVIPVVVIHGALRSRAGLWPVVRYLRRRGFEAEAFGYATRSDSLERHGERLEQFVETWLQGQAVPTLGILTHSMGGLVARAYLTRPGAARQASRQRVAMLAPPNQGAALAEKMRGFSPFRWIYGRAADELRPSRVATLAALPASVEALILAGGKLEGERGILPWIDGNNDGMVGLAETALPGVVPVLVGGSHSLLQWRPSVLARAAEFLRGGAG
jgi:pimeloyl-ACP methyl ester carboxylesterase